MKYIIVWNKYAFQFYTQLEGYICIVFLLQAAQTQDFYIYRNQMSDKLKM